MAVEPTSLDIYTAIAVRGGTQDLDVFNACHRLLRPGGVFLDIGANVGFLTIEMAQRMGSAVDIFSFEPQPALARVIAISAALNGFANVRIFDLMLSDMAGTAELFIPATSIHASAINRGGSARAIQCPTQTVDNLLASGVMPAPTVMKVDVEGAELKVFRGAENTIERHRPAIIFESDANADRFGYGRSDLLDYLRMSGNYRFYLITGMDQVEPYETDGGDEDRNLIAIPAERTLTPTGDWID